MYSFQHSSIYLYIHLLNIYILSHSFNHLFIYSFILEHDYVSQDVDQEDTNNNKSGKIRRLKLALSKAEKQCEKFKKLYYSCKKKLCRNQQMINQSNDKLSEAIKQSELSKYDKEILVKGKDTIAGKLFYRSVEERQDYDLPLKRFAMTLHFYSPKSYHFLRKAFNNAIPHPKTLYNWCTKLDASPGFTEPAFKYLKGKIAEEVADGKQPLFALSLDAMAIMKRVEFDGKQFIGGVNLGLETGEENPTGEEATEAMVFLLSGVNTKYKLPLGYFFIKSLSGEELANLVKICVGKLNDINATVITLICDGPANHIAMARILGAKFSDTCIDSYISLEQFLVWILDMSHMVKLVRNTWGDYETFKIGDKLIKWEFVRRLWEL